MRHPLPLLKDRVVELLREAKKPLTVDEMAARLDESRVRVMAAIYPVSKVLKLEREGVSRDGFRYWVSGKVLESVKGDFPMPDNLFRGWVKPLDAGFHQATNWVVQNSCEVEFDEKGELI